MIICRCSCVYWWQLWSVCTNCRIKHVLLFVPTEGFNITNIQHRSHIGPFSTSRSQFTRCSCFHCKMKSGFNISHLAHTFIQNDNRWGTNQAKEVGRRFLWEPCHYSHVTWWRSWRVESIRRYLSKLKAEIIYASPHSHGFYLIFQVSYQYAAHCAASNPAEMSC